MPGSRTYCLIAFLSILGLASNFFGFAGELERDYKPTGTWSGSLRELKAFPPIDLIQKNLVPEGWQEKVFSVISDPTIKATSMPETFNCDPTTYEWLLENPHHAVTMWKMLGAKCSGIEKEGPQAFYSKEVSGNNINFYQIVDRDGCKIWYAHGVGKPTALLPAIPIQAVIVLQYQESVINKSVKHQMTVYAKTDSKAALIITKALGASMMGMPEKTVGQMQMFFGALAWYLERNPERAENLLKATLVRKDTPKRSSLKP